jgi:hypothetical protein
MVTSPVNSQPTTALRQLHDVIEDANPLINTARLTAFSRR